MTHTTNGTTVRTLAATVTGAALVLALGACAGGAPTPTVDPIPAAATAPPVADQNAPTTNSGGSGQAGQAGQGGQGQGGSGQAGGTVVDPRAEIEVEDQRGDGRSVAVRTARLSIGGGHVAVFDRNRTLLGSAQVPASGGPTTVALSTAVGSGELIAVLYGDDGDGRFDPNTDPRVLDEENESETEDFDYRVG